MAQQVFNQWLPVAKAQNEQGQEVYLPFAGIRVQTRDGNDEVIVGAGNMVWTGSMWVPVSTQNRLPVDAAVSGTVDVSDRADRQLGKVTLTGQIGADVPNPVLSEIPTTTLTDTFPDNVADLTHSPSNVPMVVDWAMIASNSPFLIILMEPRDAAGATNRRKTVGQGFVNLNGTPNFYAIRDGYYPGWEIVEWNQEADLYKARFTGPAEWPFGGRIRLQKGGPSPTIQVAATWSYRLMEVVNHE